MLDKHNFLCYYIATTVEHKKYFNKKTKQVRKNT